MNARTRTHGLTLAAAAMFSFASTSALGAVTYRYALDRGGYEALPNGDVTLRVYLEEVTTGGTTSLLVSENGLSSAAFKIERLTPAPSQPSRIIDATSIATNTTDFAPVGDPIFGPAITVAATSDNATVLVFANAGGVTGTAVSPGVRRIWIANVTLRAGTIAGQTSSFRISDYDDAGDDTITWNSFLVLDGADYGIASATVDVLTTSAYPNDACASATPISDGTFSCSNGLATTDGPAEPIRFGSADPQISNDRWWRYTAPFAGSVKVFTCGSGYDTRLAVYNGTCPTASNTTLVASDNYCGLASSLFFTAAQNGQYLIRVGGAGTTRGFGTLFVTGCPADLDDGSGLGHRDGGITIEDLLYYLQLFGQGLVGADFDDGSSTGTRDGGVTIDDLLYFLNAYQRGC